MATPVQVQTLSTFWQRLKGVRGVKNYFVPVWIPGCKAVHTFGTQQPLHLLWLSAAGVITRIDKNVPPQRIKACLAAAGVLELSSHDCVTPYVVGQKLKLKGQALVEAAFVMPVLFLLLFGFVEIGLMLHAQQRLTYVSQYATQVGSLTNQDTKITGAVADFFPGNTVQVAVTNTQANTNQPIPAGSRRYSDFLAVQLQQPYQLNIPFLPLNLFDLTAESRARVLCQNDNPPHQCD